MQYTVLEYDISTVAKGPVKIFQLEVVDGAEEKQDRLPRDPVC